MKKSLRLFLMVCSLFQFSFAQEMPSLIFASIINYTPYDLVLIDRINGYYFDLPAQQGADYSYGIENHRNVVIDGSMQDCMMSQAQFILQAENLSDDVKNEQVYYLNICAVPGGVNDGSNIIVGALGTIALKFCMVGEVSGCLMSTSCVKDCENNTIKLCLELYCDERDINNKNFKILAECSPVIHQQAEYQNAEYQNNKSNQANSSTSKTENKNDDTHTKKIDSSASNESFTQWISRLNKETPFEVKLGVAAAVVCLGYDIYAKVYGLR